MVASAKYLITVQLNGERCRDKVLAINRPELQLSFLFFLPAQHTHLPLATFHMQLSDGTIRCILGWESWIGFFDGGDQKGKAVVTTGGLQTNL